MNALGQNSNSLVLYDRQNNYTFETAADMIRVVDRQDPAVVQKVADITFNYRQISTSQSLEELSQIGRILQYAYAATSGNECRKNVSALLVDYNSLLGASVLTANCFVDSCLLAVKYHMTAFQALEKPNVSAALKIVSQCSEIANEMAQQSKDMAHKAEKLCEQSKIALIATEGAAVQSQTRRQSIEEKFVDFTARQARLKQLTDDLAKNIQEEQENEQRARIEAYVAMVLGFTEIMTKELGAIWNPATATANSMIKGFSDIAKSKINEYQQSSSPSEAGPSGTPPNITQIFDPIEKILETKKKELKQEEEKTEKDEEKIIRLKREIEEQEVILKTKEKLKATIEVTLKRAEDALKTQAAGHQLRESIAKRKAELQREQRQANGDLAELVTRIQSCTQEKQYVERAVAALELAVKTLGQVQAIFNAACLYWESMKKKCADLSKINQMSSYAEVNQEEDLRNKIQDSAWNWLVLGKISVVASNSVEQSYARSKKFLSNLPNSQESQQLITSSSMSLRESLA